MSKETCELPWYQSFSAGCALAGGVSIGAAAAAFGGGLSNPATWALLGSWGLAGAVIGYCSCRLAGRLRKVLVSPPFDAKSGQTTVCGELIAIGRSDPLKPFGDGDWLYNVATRDRTVLEVAFDGSTACVRTEAPPDFLHCEITSAIGTAGCIGQMVGAVVGAVAGSAAGVAVGVAIAAGCAAAGIFWLLCVIVAAIVALIVAAVITAVATEIGEYVGKAIGAAIDAAGDPTDIIPDVAEVGSCVCLTGDWVTDRDHGWNEIHDIRSAMILDSGGRICGGVIGAAATGLTVPERPGVPK